MMNSNANKTMRLTVDEPSATRNPIPLLLIIWAIGIGTVIGVRYRTGIGPYLELHRWLKGQGVPDAIRNLDSLIWFTLAAIFGGLVVKARLRQPITKSLCLQRGTHGWVLMTVAALAPMVLGGAILGISRELFKIEPRELILNGLPGVVRAPWMEEILFRGLLVALPGFLLGWRGGSFQVSAILSALLFAATHIAWSAAGLADGWTALPVTAIGGLWYAWLLYRWRSIWVPMVLHAGMNLGWMLASATGGAGGGGWTENLLRVATIVIATVWTVRATRPRDWAAGDGSAPMVVSSPNPV